LAADLLLEPQASVGAVARRVGYGSPFTFSTAFKRAHGTSPSGWRAQAQATAEATA
jgi:AraC-like DNA-binding protein